VVPFGANIEKEKIMGQVLGKLEIFGSTYSSLFFHFTGKPFSTILVWSQKVIPK
jgi:hypothetical protein